MSRTFSAAYRGKVTRAITKYIQKLARKQGVEIDRVKFKGDDNWMFFEVPEMPEKNLLKFSIRFKYQGIPLRSPKPGVFVAHTHDILKAAHIEHKSRSSKSGDFLKNLQVALERTVPNKATFFNIERGESLVVFYFDRSELDRVTIVKNDRTILKVLKILGGALKKRQLGRDRLVYFVQPPWDES